MTTQLEKGMPPGSIVYFATFENGLEIKVWRSQVLKHHNSIVWLTEPGCDDELSGYIPIEWAAIDPMCAVQALRNRVAQETIQMSHKLKLLTEQLVEATQRFNTLHDELSAKVVSTIRDAPYRLGVN